MQEYKSVGQISGIVSYAESMFVQVSYYACGLQRVSVRVPKHSSVGIGDIVTVSYNFVDRYPTNVLVTF